MESILAEYDERGKYIVLARRCGLGQADAEDVVQDVFMRALSAGVQGPAHSFLFTSVRNACRDFFKKKRLDVVHLDFEFKDGRTMADLIGASDRLDDALLEAEQILALRSQLGARGAKMLLRSEYADYEEQARVTGLNTGTVRSRLSRVRAKAQRLVEAGLI